MKHVALVREMLGQASLSANPAVLERRANKLLRSLAGLLKGESNPKISDYNPTTGLRKSLAIDCVQGNPQYWVARDEASDPPAELHLNHEEVCWESYTGRHFAVPELVPGVDRYQRQD